MQLRRSTWSAPKAEASPDDSAIVTASTSSPINRTHQGARQVSSSWRGTWSLAGRRACFLCHPIPGAPTPVDAVGGEPNQSSLPPMSYAACIARKRIFLCFQEATEASFFCIAGAWLGGLFRYPKKTELHCTSLDRGYPPYHHHNFMANLLCCIFIVIV